MTTFADPIELEITDTSLDEVQYALKVVFPDDYKRFLLQYNGGDPIPNILQIPALNEKVIIESFFGIGRPYLDLERWNKEIRRSLDMTPQFLAIAFDVTGNKLIFDLASPQRSEIYYWDSARQFDSSTDAANAYLVADSFTDLLTKFQETL